MFAYCLNNPINTSDPGGNWPKWLNDAVSWVASKLGITTNNGSASRKKTSATAKGPTISRNTTMGYFTSKVTASIGYATGSVRGQATKSGKSASKTMIGAFGKASVASYDSQNRFGNSTLGVSKKDVLDIGVVTAQAGVQYKNGLGLSIGAKASAASARGTYCFDAFGCKVEVGMSAQVLTAGYELSVGALPDGGWGIKNGGNSGIFGVGYLIRITPP